MDAGDDVDEDSLLSRLPAKAGAPVVVLVGGTDGVARGTANTPGHNGRTHIRRLEVRGGRFMPRAPSIQPAATHAMTLAADELHDRIVHSLRTAGVAAPAAHTVARVLVDAERRGHSSHGVALLATYLRRIHAGGIVPNAQPQLTQPAPTIATIDAGGGLGQVAADQAARWCSRTAAEHGVAVAAVHTNNHVGMLAAYRMPFQEHGVTGLLLNTSGPSVAAPGAVRPTLGSNALCLVMPQPGHDEPFCVDMATGVVAAGKIRDALNRGASVPEGWLLDAGGQPTTDPSRLDAGGSVPLFGGYKGLGVSLIVELIAGALAGARVSPDVAKQRKQPGHVMGCSQLFVGLSVRHFARGDEIAAPLLVDRLREAVAAGYDTLPDGPWFPDQLEEGNAHRMDAHGLNVPASVAYELGWGHPA
jgi:LDH2 family malate/lactate/ureidoglycolate dehydrogenase